MCYRAYHSGFCFPFRTETECPIEVLNSYRKTQEEIINFRSQVQIKVLADFKFIGEEKEKNLAELLTNAIMVHNSGGYYLGREYPLYELRVDN